MKRILTVDNDHDIVEVINIYLTSIGHEVTSMETAENLVENIRASRPDILFLDINLGEFDGRNVCALIKSDADISGTTVILVSASTALNNSMNQKYPPNDVIAKPFNLSQLNEMVTKYA